MEGIDDDDDDDDDDDASISKLENYWGPNQIELSKVFKGSLNKS